LVCLRRHRERRARATRPSCSARPTDSRATSPDGRAADDCLARAQICRRFQSDWTIA
jgi:hypothetical protein